MSEDARKGMVALMAAYKAHVKKGASFWIVTVPEIGQVTQARSIEELNLMTTDLIRLVTEDEKPTVTYSYDLPPEVAEAVELKRQAAELEARAMATQGAAAKKLHELGVSLRDIGRLLGISHQRAHQLVKA